jgi:hypothetical protein
MHATRALGHHPPTFSRPAGLATGCNEAGSYQTSPAQIHPNPPATCKCTPRHRAKTMRPPTLLLESQWSHLSKFKSVALPKFCLNSSGFHCHSLVLQGRHSTSHKRTHW